jgi:hypothetical protein
LSETEGDLITATFNGAGHVTFTEVNNTNGKITTKSGSGPYCVAANGAFTIGTGSAKTNGFISNNGNTIVTFYEVTGEGPSESVGVKQGAIPSGNNASGVLALASNTTGANNTVMGYDALSSNTTGGNNVAVGFEAGLNLTTGSNNIDIGNPGEAADGIGANSGVIRIGVQSTTALQTNTYIAGIYDNTSVSGLPVVIDSNGQLGTVSSSERFKIAIASMGSNTTKLQQLRPVTFQYKADPEGTQRYGLIAEEVAKVYPELVVHDSKGRIDGVRYDELAPMLLNEMQRQQRVNAAQATKIASLEQQLAGIQAGLVKLQPKDELVAQR